MKFSASHFRFHQTCDNPKPLALFIDYYQYHHSASKFQVIPLNSSLNFSSVNGDFVVQDYLNVSEAKISQSYNGLLLCCSQDYYGFLHYLCNPTTGQMKRLDIPDNNKWCCLFGV